MLLNHRVFILKVDGCAIEFFIEEKTPHIAEGITQRKTLWRYWLLQLVSSKLLIPSLSKLSHSSLA